MIELGDSVRHLLWKSVDTAIFVSSKGSLNAVIEDSVRRTAWPLIEIPIWSSVRRSIKASIWRSIESKVRNGR